MTKLQAFQESLTRHFDRLHDPIWPGPVLRGELSGLYWIVCLVRLGNVVGGSFRNPRRMVGPLSWSNDSRARLRCNDSQAWKSLAVSDCKRSRGQSEQGDVGRASGGGRWEKEREMKKGEAAFSQGL